MNDAAEAILQGMNQRSATWRTGLATKLAGSQGVADAAVGLGDVISKIPNMIAQKQDVDEQAQVDHAFSGEMLRSGDAIKATDAALAVPVTRHGAAAKQAALAHGRFQLQMHQQELQSNANAAALTAQTLEDRKRAAGVATGIQSAAADAAAPRSPGSVDLEGLSYPGMPAAQTGGVDLPGVAPTGDQIATSMETDPRVVGTPMWEHLVDKRRANENADNKQTSIDAKTAADLALRKETAAKKMSDQQKLAQQQRDRLDAMAVANGYKQTAATTADARKTTHAATSFTNREKLQQERETGTQTRFDIAQATRDRNEQFGEWDKQARLAVSVGVMSRDDALGQITAEKAVIAGLRKQRLALAADDKDTSGVDSDISTYEGHLQSAEKQIRSMKAPEFTVFAPRGGGAPAAAAETRVVNGTNYVKTANGWVAK